MGLIPHSLQIWWRWYLWEKEHNGKARVLKKMLAFLLDGDKTMILSKG